MKSRDEYIIKMQAKLAEWDTEINMLVARGDEIASDVKAEYKAQVEMLKEKLVVARKKVEELQQAGDNAWNDLKSGLEVVRFAMKESINSARSRFR
jgi:hypothetical protein